MAIIDEDIETKIEDVCQELLKLTKQSVEEGEIEINSKQVYIPSETVHASIDDIIVSDNIVEEEINNYYPAVHNAVSLENNNLTELANLISDNKIYDTNNISWMDRTEIYDTEENEYLVDEIGIYKYDIRNLVARYSEYVGGFNFDRNDFNYIFTKNMKKLMGKPREFSIYCPIMNLAGDFDSISLPTEFDFKNIYDRYEIKNAEIIRKSSNIVAGLFTTVEREVIPRADPKFEPRWTHLLKLDILGHPTTNSYRQYIKSLGRCLRLRKPKSEIAYMGPAFIEEIKLFSKRMDIPYISWVAPPELKVREVYTTKTYGLTVQEHHNINSKEIKDLKSFIMRYLDHLNAEKNNEISATLRRYDEMFTNLYIEDKLVDCTIGFEGSILRDIGNTSSFTFRLKLRSGSLLDSCNIDRETIHDFFKSLYYIRGEIIHNDRDINDIIGNLDFEPPQYTDEDMTAENYAIFARNVLAKTIISYLDIDIDFGLGVTETNHLIDNKALDIRLDFEEFE